MLKRRKKPSVRKQPAESRAVEFLTVGWMISVLTTLICELGSLAAALFVRWRPDATGVQVMSGFLLFAALVIGLIGLALTPLILKARRVRPPTGITVFAVVVQAAPLVAVLLNQVK